MAASAFILYNPAKRFLLNGTTDLDTNVVRAYLFKGSSNASTTTLSSISQVLVAVSGGYSGARTLSGLSVAASGDAVKFDATDPIFTASGANIANVQYVVIGASGAGGNKAVCWSRLSASPFTVTSGNTLTVQFNAAGIFALT